MKKLVLILPVILSAFNIFAQSDYFDSLVFTNTFGGDNDRLLEELVELNNQDGKFSPDFYLNDRFQIDYKSKKINSRIRLDSSILCFDRNNLVDSDSGFYFRPRGYVSFKPFDFIEAGAGNYCFSKYSAKGGELFALDEVPCGAKLVEGGIYLGANFNGFCAFVSLNNSSETFETLSAEYRFGAEYKLKNKFTIAADVFNQNESVGYGIFSSLDFIPNLDLNFGIVYGDSEEYFYKDLYYNQTLRFDFSGRYEIIQRGIVLSVDYLQNLVEHSSNKGLPFLGAVRIDWNFLNINKIDLNFSYSGFYGENPKFKLKGGFNYSIDTGAGTFGTGIHLTANHNGLKKIGIPLTWKYKYTVKK